MSNGNRKRPLSEKEIAELADQFGEISDQSDYSDIDSTVDIAETVSEPDDFLEYISEEDTDLEPEISDDNQTGSNNSDVEYTAKSGMKWKAMPAPSTRRKKKNIVNCKPGPTNICDAAVTIKDYFNLLLSDDIKNIICQYTNDEATKYYQKWNAQHSDSQKAWKMFDVTEFDSFVGVLLMAGALRCRRESVREMWSTDTSIRRAFFTAAMSRTRFSELMIFMRFDDKGSRDARRATDKLAAIRDVWDLFVDNCKKCFHPNEHVTIDEQLVAFRGKCPFRQYIKSKPGRYGIKVWASADVDTSYLHNLQVYTGKLEGNKPEREQGYRVVMDMSEPLFGSGRGITTDNFFTSMKLAQDLLTKNLTLLGTVRKNKTDTPLELSTKVNRSVTSSKFAFSGDITMVSYIPKKNRMVHLLSTQHDDDAVSDQEHKKPIIIMDYNRTKGAVDNSDKLIREYTCARRTARWPMRIFMNILDICGLNAYVLYISKHTDWNKGKSHRRQLFIKDLSHELASSNMKRRANNSEKLQEHIKQALRDCGILNIPGRTVKYNDDTNMEKKRGRCYQCTRAEDKKSRIKCDVCKNFVCEDHRKKTTSVICIANCEQ